MDALPHAEMLRTHAEFVEAEDMPRTAERMRATADLFEQLYEALKCLVLQAAHSSDLLATDYGLKAVRGGRAALAKARAEA